MSGVITLGPCSCCGCETLFEANFNTLRPGLEASPGSGWTVLNPVDVIGQPLSGGPFFDLLPGNGLYLDMAGSFGTNPLRPADYRGDIHTSLAYAIEVGFQYVVSYRLAGNQRDPAGGQTLRIRLEGLLTSGGGPVSYLNTTRTVSSWVQPFTLYTHDIIPSQDGLASLRFSQDDAGTPAFYGVLLDDVKFEKCPL